MIASDINISAPRCFTIHPKQNMPRKLFYRVGKDNNDDLFLLEETHQPIAHRQRQTVT